MAKVDLYAQDWCELIFAGRNKAYGAYQMRSQTGARNTKSLVTLIILAALAVGIPLFFTYVVPHKKDTTVTTVTNLSKLEEAKVEDKHIIKKVEPKRAEPQRIKSSIKFTAPKIEKDENVQEEDEMKTQKELGESKLAISIADVKGNDDVHGKDIADIKEVITSQPDEEAKVYDYVEQMPQFPGGDEALLKWITDHLTYPSASMEAGTQGKVIVRFVVTENGTVGDVQLLTHVDTYCDREAEKVVRSLPKFTPGRQQGKPVKVWYQVPVVFELI
ncbi:MAG: energy transducer TonB [Bacteroidaceae bacterium]|nr:energy transducer TonB [Bacteroidaceae bacterium]